MVNTFKWQLFFLLFLIVVHAIYNSESTMEGDDDDDDCGNSVGGEQDTNAQHLEEMRSCIATTSWANLATAS